MVNTPLLPMLQKTSSDNNNNNNNVQTVDLAAAKLSDLYGSSNVPRLDGPDKFFRPSKGHIHDCSSGPNNGGTNNGVYGDDGDLIQGHHAPGVGRVQGGSSRGLRNGGGGTWSGAQSPALSNTKPDWLASGWFNLGLGPPGLAGMPSGLNIAQLAQLNGMNSMNPFNMIMNMLNSFGRLQGGIGGNGLRGGRSGGHSHGQHGGSASSKAGSAGNSEYFEPVVLNDGAGWLRTLRSHNNTRTLKA
ncbi:hypothetical protein EDB85DRAFT_2157202 [Lactarius pseudohatsudake]|nr:hypothetical protein EDB85DRAFT_2157202 [Lactarius pseudohatsudake]